MKSSTEKLYDRDDIVDAPEYYQYSQGVWHPHLGVVGSSRPIIRGSGP